MQIEMEMVGRINHHHTRRRAGIAPSRLVLILILSLHTVLAFQANPSIGLPLKPSPHWLLLQKIGQPYFSRQRIGCAFPGVHGMLASESHVNFSEASPPKTALLKYLDLSTSMFPLWVLLAALTGYVRPSTYSWFSGDLITIALASTMLFMGMTLTLDDFRECLKRPQVVLSGVFAQYTIMPLLGLVMSKLLRLPPGLAAGLILVGCCPGGTASNLVALIANADVALSVTMTAASTAGAALATPLLTRALVGSLVAVDGRALLASTAQLVLAPVAAGVALNRFAPGLSAGISAFTPLASVLAVAGICGSVVAAQAASGAARQAGAALLAAVVGLHAGGFALGYVSSKLLLGQSEKISRTVSIEVGMQNSALAVVLASKAFSDPSSCLPGAISATCHSVLGSILAGLWRYLSSKEHGKNGNRPNKED